MPTLDDVLNFLGHNIFDRTLSVALLGVTVYLLYRWIFEPAHTTLKGILSFWRLRESPATFLEITPPKHSEKSQLATQQLFTVLRQTIGRTKIASLEIVASRKEGVRYLIRINPGDVTTLQRNIASYMPEVRFRELKDEPPTLTGNCTAISEPKQRRHYAYPLMQNEELDKSDVVAYIAGSMGKLRPGETMTLQMVITPYSSHWTSRIYNKILNRGYAQIDGKLRQFIVQRWWVWLFALIIGAFTNDINLALSWGFVFLVASFFVKRDEPTLTPHEEELYQGILNKLGQPLFRTDTRITVAAESSQRIDQLFKGVSGSLAPLNSPFQALGDSALFQNKVSYRFREFKFTRRLPSLLVTNSSIFAARNFLPYINIDNITEGVYPEATIGLTGKKMAILGKGNIGQQVGHIAEALGMQVNYFQRGDVMADVVRDADVVVDALSVKPDSNDLLNDDFFAALKNGAFFVTVSAGKILDTDAMFRALDSGKLAFAASDAQTPADTRDPIYRKLLAHPKVLVTPHVAFNSDVSNDTGNLMMIENVEAWVRGEPIHVVRA
ncbi:D-isomer specific 2-hydroxyacid dehydrogenase, NAD-binding [candidate division TM7 genomosp. GTL1]|nr:D-isomer specific 2-hydroxyacid dehydrogenase, NAD-binding [candidate division TM7 genomosp. GTL1]